MIVKYTQLKSTGRKILKDILPLSKPFTLLIEPSSLCNFKCIQCFQRSPECNYFTETRQNMSLELFAKIIEQLKNWQGDKLKVLKLSLYGEPLVNKNFCEMLRLAKEADIAERIETTTNASLLTRETAETLVKYQLDYIRVSIYAVDQKKHEEITGSNIDIHQIKENLLTLQKIKKEHKSERPFIGAKMLDSYDEEENRRFISEFQNIADEAYLDKPHSWIKVDGLDVVKKYYKDCYEKVSEDLQSKSNERVACPMPFTTMAVRANGDVSPCCVDFIGGTNLGNVKESSLTDIWKSDRWFEFQKMQLENRKYMNSSCARCDVYKNSHYTLDNIDGFPVEKLH